MKKKLAVILTTALAITMLGACTKKEEKATESQTTEQTATGHVAVDPVEVKDIIVEDYVTLGEYKGLTFTVNAKEEYTQDDIGSIALSVYSNYVTDELGGITDKAVEMGDEINLDYAGYLDGVAFDGGTAAGQYLEIGSGGFIPGFEDGLVGVMPGETVDLNISFPEVYDPNPDLAGKPVVFTVTVNYIYPSSAEQMVDEVVESMGDEEFKTVQELLAYAEKYLAYMAESNYISYKQYATIEAIMAVVEVSDVPAGVTETYYNNIYASLSSEAAQYMTDVDTYCSYFYGMTAESYAYAYAEETAKQSMVIQAIANAENLNVSDDELNDKLVEYAKKNGTTVEEIRAAQDDAVLIEYFMIEKVIDFVIENGNVTEV